MQVHELIKYLSDWSPDTNVKYLPTTEDQEDYPEGIDILLSVSDDNNTIFIQEDLGSHQIIIGKKEA